MLSWLRTSVRIPGQANPQIHLILHKLSRAILPSIVGIIKSNLQTMGPKTLAHMKPHTRLATNRTMIPLLLYRTTRERRIGRRIRNRSRLRRKALRSTRRIHSIALVDILQRITLRVRVLPVIHDTRRCQQIEHSLPKQVTELAGAFGLVRIGAYCVLFSTKGSGGAGDPIKTGNSGVGMGETSVTDRWRLLGILDNHELGCESVLSEGGLAGSREDIDVNASNTDRTANALIEVNARLDCAREIDDVNRGRRDHRIGRRIPELENLPLRRKRLLRLKANRIFPLA